MPAEGVEFVPREELLTYEEIERVARVFVDLGVTKIRISGGEPTLRKDLTTLVSRIGSLPLQSLAMTTNGYRFRDIAMELRRAGMRRVNISLDTLRRDRFTQMARFDGFERVWESIGRALEVGYDPVKINTVVVRGLNDDEVLDFARLTEKIPVHVRFIEYMPSSSMFGNRFDDARVVKVDEIRKRIEDAFPLLPVDVDLKTGPARLYGIPGFAGKVGFIDPYGDHFCASCNRVRLTSLGRLKWCLFSNEGLDVKAFLRSGKSDEELADWIRGRIVTDKPEYHPVMISDMVQASTVFSQVGG
jgi:cyclic pyranopterin phosphate synthase